MVDPNVEARLNACVAAAGLDPDTPMAVAVQIGESIGYVNTPVAGSPDRKINQATLLYAASLAKQVVGACFALAVRDGTVRTSDSLQQWFPELPGWAASVNLGQLVCHTGALPGETELLQRMKEDGETARTTPGMIAALHRFRDLESTPGTSFSYSNIGYVCLARIIELAGGDSLETFSKRRIFEPLGMRHSRFWRGPDALPVGAVPVDPEPIVGLPFSLGDGGLWTTVQDFLRWNDAMNRDLLGISETVQQTGTLDDGTPLDYAWGIRKIECQGFTGWSHGGSWPGIYTKSVRFPEIPASFVAFTLHTDIDPILRLTEKVQDFLAGHSQGNSD
ncbi:MAG: serine hydrolase [Thermomicrobiales bacterium]